MPFHWRDGIHFERIGDGDVCIFNELHDRQGVRQKVNITIIPASEWVSIVEAMAHPTSRGCDGSLSHRVAHRLHMIGIGGC